MLLLMASERGLFCFMGHQCTICHHPRRIKIEKDCLTHKKGDKRLAAAQSVDPSITQMMVRNHFDRHQITIEAANALSRKFSALEALDDIISRGVGKATPKASDVVAASRAKYNMELEERRINEFKRFIYAYAADPDGVVRDPKYAHLFPKEVKLGKIEKIPNGNTGRPSENDTPSKE